MAYGAILNQTQPYPTPAEIGAVAVGFYDGDLDLLTTDGHYRLGENVTNGPSGAPYAWCQIIVTHGVNTDTNAQILVDNTGRIYSRIYWAGEWRDWISSVSKSGDTMTGGLNFRPVGVTGYTQIYKNATRDSVDYGTLVLDRDSTGKMIGLKLYSAAQKAKIVDGTSEYDIYYAGNKPTASDIQAGTLAGQVYANPTASATHNAFQVRNICAQDSDIVAGSSALQSGYIVLVYE